MNLSFEFAKFVFRFKQDSFDLLISVPLVKVLLKIFKFSLSKVMSTGRGCVSLFSV